nr:hypothetical protein [Tanacetum cinerariifolium]
MLKSSKRSLIFVLEYKEKTLLRKNIDYLELMWEDFVYQTNHMKEKKYRKENMPFPRFTKVSIKHFISKNQSLSKLKHKHYHTIKDDDIVSKLKFVRGKGSQGKNVADDLHDTVDLSKELEHEPAKKTGRKSTRDVVIQDTLSAPKLKLAKLKLKQKGDLDEPKGISSARADFTYEWGLEEDSEHSEDDQPKLDDEEKNDENDFVIDDYSRFTWIFFLATKDETSGILKSFITRIENLVDHKVKVTRCDNRTEFKNREMNHFCEMKGILRQFSVARTPQQNVVAEMRNMTLIEAARTMLADSKTPTLSFMKPFGCPVTILNTIDHLGKFNGKADEGIFVGYSFNSKAFKVFNNRTRIVEENFHTRFSENTPNVIGSGPDWLFDIDAVTRIMNYEPIVACTRSNGFVAALDFLE